MWLIQDKSAIQAELKWKILNEDILSGKKQITYISPGGFRFLDNKGRELSFDWQDSASRIVDNYIITDLYSFDNVYINDCLKDDGYEELIKDVHRLEFFDEFKTLVELFCLLDIEMYEDSNEGNLECVSFELYDPITQQELKII